MIWILIQRFNVKRWKIFRYYPITYKALDNEDYFAIEDDEYEKLKRKILQVTSDSKLKLILMIMKNLKQLTLAFFQMEH